jgi:acetylornithine deacetylase
MTQSLAILEKLISFPTVSKDSNLALTEYVQRFLGELGIQSSVVYNEEKTKANLWTTIGPSNMAGVALSAHTDVVPVVGQNWSSDPFEMARRDGKLYGRGTADMKGFIACCLAMAARVDQSKLTSPIHFAFSYDEEIGCIGVRRLLDMLKTLPFRPRFCIVGEPTMLQVVTAHKGKLGFRVTAHGLEAHSSLAPIGVNAIYMACDLIAEIRHIQDDLAAHGARDGEYEVAYTTLHVGKMSGGVAMNIVPNDASFDFEIRYLPKDDQHAIVARIKQSARDVAKRYAHVFADARFVFSDLQSYPALDTPVDSEVVNFVRALTGGNSTGKITFGTEGGLFQQELGIPAVVCGPGNIAVAHKPDEYVSEEQMQLCDDMLGRLVERLSA